VCNPYRGGSLTCVPSFGTEFLNSFLLVTFEVRLTLASSFVASGVTLRHGRDPPRPLVVIHVIFESSSRKLRRSLNFYPYLILITHTFFFDISPALYGKGFCRDFPENLLPLLFFLPTALERSSTHHPIFILDCPSKSDSNTWAVIPVFPNSLHFEIAPSLEDKLIPYETLSHYRRRRFQWACVR